MVRSTLPLLALCAAAGCGGGGNGPSIPPSPQEPIPSDASPGGIWEGSSSLGFTVVALVTESGQFHLLRGDGVQFVGIASTSDERLSANFVGYAPFPQAFGDGSTTGTGTLAGTVKERKSFDADSSFRTSKGAASDSTIALSYEKLYERDSSLGTIAGNYLDTERNAVMSVNDDGTLFSQDPGNHCVLNGAVSVIEPEFNLYRVSYEFSNCRGRWSRLNGTDAEGLATLDDTRSPEALVISVVVEDVGYAFAGVLPRE